MRRLAVTYVIVALLAACSYLGLPQASTFHQRAAVALGTVSAVRDSAAAMLGAGTLGVEDAENVQRQADLARESIDIARALHASDPGAAESRLDVTIRSLQLLQAYLRSREAPPT